LALLAVAFAVRVVAALAFPSLNHPDEAFQLFEPAHRLAFGWGVKTWEFDDGIRSWAAPAALAAVFRLAAPVVGGPAGYIDAARIALAALSLLPVWAIWRAGERESRTHAILAGLVAAVWFELVYFSFRPLTEALACDFALTALAVASPPGRALTSRALLGLGLCLALTALLRLQLAPGAALIAIVACRFEVRRWACLAAGAAPAALVFGAADWIAWGAPFASYVRAVAINLGAGKASAYGVQPWSWYLAVIAAVWGPFLPAAIALCVVRIRSSWLWIGFAAVEIAVHSAIPHKEYRFVFPALAAIAITAALGSADAVAWLSARLRTVRPDLPTAATAVAWVGASLSLAAAPQFRPAWTLARGELQSESWLAGQADLCGVLFYDPSWLETGGYAFLHRRAPLYFPAYAMQLLPGHQLAWPADMAARRTRAASAWGAYNYVVLRPASLSRFAPRYRPLHCFSGTTCVAARPGPCTPDPGLTPILAQRRLGEPSP
jgi:hypothetical protein